MIEELAATSKLLLASDFDGTLAEIVEDPDIATPLARSKAALETLADSPATTVAVIVELRREVSPDRVVIMSDDVTDETAFAVLQPGDVGIHVGLGPSLEGVKVPDPSSLANLLNTLVALRTAP